MMSFVLSADCLEIMRDLSGIGMAWFNRDEFLGFKRSSVTGSWNYTGFGV